MSDWANLPTDILYLFIQRFEYIEDFISFTYVCKPWRSISTPTLVPSLPPRSPSILWWNIRNNGIQNLYRLSTGKIYELESFPKARFLGTSHGWLFTADLNSYYPSLSLLHPFSTRQILLPHFVEESKFGVKTQKSIYSSLMVRLAMSGNPNSDDCVLLVIYPNPQYDGIGLAFLRLGDQAWTGRREPVSPGYFHDVVYYKGAFYAVSSNGTLFLCYISSDVGIATKKMTAPPLVKRRQDFKWAQAYLVESLGGLLLVYRRYKGYQGDSYSGFTVGFSVYKLVEQCEDDAVAYTWKEVEDLGGRALFVGGNATVSVAPSEHVNANCIYFSKDTGVYNITNRIFSTHFHFPICPSWYF